MKNRYYVWWPEAEELESFANKKGAEKLLNQFLQDGCELDYMTIIKGVELDISVTIRDPRESPDE